METPREKKRYNFKNLWLPKNQDGKPNDPPFIDEKKKVKYPSEDGSFGPDNYFRLIWMYFLHDAEEKLNPVQRLKVEKVLSWGAIGLFALMIIVVTLCSAFGLNK